MVDNVASGASRWLPIVEADFAALGGEPLRAVWRDSVPDHEAALAALGNAVVPPCAELVGRWIVAHGLGGRRG